MSPLLERFLRFHGNGTKQIGKNYCIPASLCNALRLCGVVGCTQERIRDEWYAEEGRQVEPDLDEQMTGAGFGLFETLERRTGFMQGVDNSFFTLPGDSDPFDLRKADLAIDFIGKHVAMQHPVIVSTWNRFYTGDIIEVHGFHMWLVLDFDRGENRAVIHDSGTDNVGQTTISSYQAIMLKGKEHQLDVGLRGCITHSDYSCLALWREPE